MELNKINSVYFLGIGGIGMSALARWFKAAGKRVAGYDRTETPLTEKLELEGMKVHYYDDPSFIPESIVEHPDTTLVVITPAIPQDHKEWKYLRDNNFEIKKRSEVLGIISSAYYTIAVGGTHGKTTTSTMIAHILDQCGINTTAFLGGISANLNSNLLLAKSEEGMKVVVEADEYDRSFLRLSPDSTVITAADPDHLDIYGDDDSLKKSYLEFISKLRSGGFLLISERAEKELKKSLPENYNVYSNTKIDGAYAANITVDNGAFVFDYYWNDTFIPAIKLNQPGYHNVENVVAAITIALSEGVNSSKIPDAVASYRGVKRRFEYILQTNRQVMIDDYAHHPVEIESFIKSAKFLYPGKKLTVVFQPHLYTRTMDFAEDFANTLSMADEVVLLDIYPARERPIPGVSSDIIFKNIQTTKYSCDKEDLLDVLSGLNIEVLATLGAGDIDKEVIPISEYLKQKYELV